jgi:hypothetical protein
MTGFLKAGRRLRVGSGCSVAATRKTGDSLKPTVYRCGGNSRCGPDGVLERLLSAKFPRGQ